MDETQSLSSFPVDLNSASQTELEATGLPAELAQAVLDYRAANGPFAAVEGLLDVPGFDRAGLDALGARVIVNLPDGPDVDVDDRSDVAGEPEKLPPADVEERKPSPDGADEVAPDDTDGADEPGFAGAPGEEAAGPAELVLQLEPDSGDALVVPEAEFEGDEPVGGVDDELVEPLPAEEVAIESTSIPEAEASVVELLGEEAIAEQADRDGDAVSAAASDVSGAVESLAVEGLVGDEADQAGEAENLPTTDELPAEPAISDSLIHVAAGDAQETGPADAAASEEAAYKVTKDYDEALVGLHEEMAPLEDTPPPDVPEDSPDVLPFEPVIDDRRTADDAQEQAKPDQRGAAEVVSALATEDAPSQQAEAEQTPQTAPRERSRWHDIGMIALGGLLGVLATLVILGVVGGTLNYAPRRLVDAMNDNLAVMQANQETTWAETQGLVARADALERRLSALEGIEDRIAALESGSADIETRLMDTAASLAQLDTELTELAQSHALMFDEFDSRISGQGREISTLNDAVTSARQTLQGVQDQVARYEAFFEALRSLLDDMQEPSAAETGA